eukprot:Tamp_08887.p1 GENE.Tamp_08887~~Tamp_08887.p1  ORF type:complete len:730 (+),score=77.00 Tamp_08887:313-2190(+)
MRGQERRMLLVAATPERYQAASRRHNRSTRTRHPPAPEPGALEHAPAARPRARSRSPEQPPSKPQKGSTQTSASAASVRLSDSDTPPSQQGAFKGGSVKRHQTKSASPESLPPNAGGSGHPLAGGRTAAGSSRDDAAKSEARVLSTGTLSEVTPVVTPFVNIQKLSGTIIVPPSLPETLYLDRYQPTKIQPSTKPIVRRGSSWLEAQQQAARAKLYLHGPFLEPHNVDAAAVLRMQAIENVPRSPPPSHRPLDAEAEDRAPRGWHPRDEQQNTPFLGVTSEQKKLRAAVDDNLNMNKPHMCGIEYMGVGQSWKLHPEHLEPSLADVARSMRRSLTGRWSVEPTAPSQPWKGVRKGRIFCNSIPNSDTPQRSRSSCAGPEDSENKSMDRSIQQENSSDYCLARKGPGAFHLVGASVPSLQRDGFRSQFGKKLDVMGRSSQDASVLTHGSYSEWREHPSKLGKMPERKLKVLHNQIGAVKDEVLQVDWTPVPATLPQLLPAAARSDISHPAFKFWRKQRLSTRSQGEPTHNTHAPEPQQTKRVGDDQVKDDLTAWDSPGGNASDDPMIEHGGLQVDQGTTFVTEPGERSDQKNQVGLESERNKETDYGFLVITISRSGSRDDECMET